MAGKSGLCTCGHIHAEKTRCNQLVSGVSAGGGGPTYCGCDGFHDVSAGAVPPRPAPQPGEPL